MCGYVHSHTKFKLSKLSLIKYYSLSQELTGLDVTSDYVLDSTTIECFCQHWKLLETTGPNIKTDFSFVSEDQNSGWHIEFSSVIVTAWRQRTVQRLKAKMCDLWILYLAKLFFVLEGNIQTFIDVNKERYEDFKYWPVEFRAVFSTFYFPLFSSPVEGNGTPLQYSCLENPMGKGAWWAAVHGVAKSWTRLSDFTSTFHFCALEKEMATHSSILAWRIPGTGEPGELLSMGSHRVGHDWSDLAVVVPPNRTFFSQSSLLSQIFNAQICTLAL